LEKWSIGDVLLVSDLDVESDLLSITALMRVGFGVNFKTGLAEIHKDKQTWGVASPTKNNGSLCYLEEYEKVQHYALAIQYIDTQTLQTWYKRLGHLNSRAIRSLIPMVISIKIGDPYTRIGECNIACTDCPKSTQHQTISRFSFTKATRSLERVSADIAGPMRCPDCTWNYKYLLVFIDHHTRYTWVFSLISRDIVLRALQIWKASAENACGNKLLILQTDNAAEFIGKKWMKVYQDEGISYYTTAPYGPSMNSYAERVIRSIVNHASSMLWMAGIREEFWALAAKASAYLLNRSPHSGLEECTPHEMWFKQKPHVGHIRVWGCRAWSAVPKE